MTAGGGTSGSLVLEVAGVKLDARRIERPRGAPDREPTLVFLHEGLGSVAQWKDFPDRLATRLGLGALVYSRRGYGASDPVPPVARPVRFMHDEAYAVLPAVLDVAKIASPLLVGHSDGASIALLYAAAVAGAAGAKRARGVVVLAPHLFVEDVTVKSIAALAEAWETTDLRARLARHHGTNVDGAFLGWSGAWLAPEFRAWNIEPEMGALAAPVLAIQGEDDEYGTLAQVDALKRRAPSLVETRVLAKCGHAPWRDKAGRDARRDRRMVGGNEGF